MEQVVTQQGLKKGLTSIVRRRFASPTLQLQAVLIAFFVAVSVSLAAIYALQPAIYETATGGLAPPILFVPLLLLITLLVVGTIRRWRWVYWLVLVAFGLSGIRIPVMALQLIGVLPIDPPLWYSLFRSLVAAIQVAIAIWMLVLHRRYGIWALHSSG
jgi:hypothetical protein